jgi:exosome complex component CSL4
MAPLKDRVPEKFVTPGEQLGVIEEFIPGSGTYVAGGEIYASEAGTMRLDTRRREVLVVPSTHRPQIPKAGDMVEGPVVSASDKTLSIEIKGINGDPTSGGLTGIMHVSDIARGYVKSATDAFRVGDIIRAKVVSTKNREYHLTTAEDRLGAIKANCIYCGGALILMGRNLTCGKCREMARRKITSDFGQPSSGWVTA